MTTWTGFVPGEPVAKARPRVVFRKNAGHPVAITPNRTAEWEARATAHLREAWGRRPALNGPVGALITVLVQRPGRLVWKRRAMPRQPVVAKPDWDNFGKGASDAVEKAGIVVNDSQLWCVTVTKEYCAAGEQPGVEVQLTWHEDVKAALLLTEARP